MDWQTLRKGNLFEGLDDEQVARIAEIARPCALQPGERLLLLGDSADRVFLVVKGKVDLCFPFSFRGYVKDVCVETMLPGSALGWSALVKPYRFTLSARAQEACEVATFFRKDLLRLFEDDTALGYIFMKRIAEIIGDRLLKIQALWARELQRAVTQMLESQTTKETESFRACASGGGD